MMLIKFPSFTLAYEPSVIIPKTNDLSLTLVQERAVLDSSRRMHVQPGLTLKHFLYFCVLCLPQNKQRLFPYTTLTAWFL